MIHVRDGEDYRQGLVGSGGEAMEAMKGIEEVDSESDIRINDIGLYAALIPQ
jgi:hypothetical protein